MPRKSFKILGNKPLAHWIVDTLLSIDRPDVDLDIWINTDSEEVAQLYVGKDVRIYMRPKEVQGDDVSMNTVLADWMEHIAAEPYDFYIQTHITNPFLSKESILRAIDMYLKYGVGYSIMGVTRHQCRMWYKAKPVNFMPGAVIPTQDLKPLYEDNSCIYIFSDYVFKAWGRASCPPKMLEIPWPENIDIDTEEEWNMARLVANEFI